MFKNLKNIQTTFELMRALTLISLVGSLVVVVYVTYSSQSLIAKEREKIYVLDQGKSLILALQQDMAGNRPIEARSHVKRFHELFFNLLPDQQAINYQLQQSFVISDKSAYNYYLDLKESGYYHRLIGTSTTQRIQIDSVVLNMDVYPYFVTTYARQIILRESNVTSRLLITECNLINTPNMVRSDNNPHGFLIENFKIINNNEISRERR